MWTKRAFTAAVFDLIERASRAVEQRKLSHAGFHLVYILSTFANRDNRTATWPSQALLRDRLGLKSIRGVQNLLDAASSLSLITVESGKGRHRVSTYHLVLDADVLSGKNRKRSSPLSRSLRARASTEKANSASSFDPLSGDSEKANCGSEKGELPFQKRRTVVRTEPLIEPLNEPLAPVVAALAASGARLPANDQDVESDLATIEHALDSADVTPARIEQLQTELDAVAKRVPMKHRLYPTLERLSAAVAEQIRAQLEGVQ
jgi:hypothetical protein